MQTESKKYLELLERRLALLDRLTEALSSARGDLVAMDLESIRAGIREQQGLCASISSLDQEISRAQAHAMALTGTPVRAEISWPAASGVEQELRERIRLTLERVARTQQDLRRRNNTHQALLRRSSRTVGVLLNLLQSQAPTYDSAPEAPSGMLCEERV
jgi:hypothetical protein